MSEIIGKNDEEKEFSEAGTPAMEALLKEIELMNVTEKVAVTQERIVKGNTRRAFLMGVVTGAAGLLYMPKISSIIFDLGIGSMLLDQKIKSYIIDAKSKFETELRNFGVPINKIENIANSIVAINNNGSLGSGFFVGKNIILTAGHIIAKESDTIPYDFSDEEGSPKVYDLNGNIYTVFDTYGDNTNDLGAIIVEESSENYLDTFGNGELGVDVMTLGFGGDRGAHVTTGQQVDTFGEERLYPIHMIQQIINRDEVNFITNYVIGGDSGSALIDKNGNLTGLITQRGVEFEQKVQDNKGIIFHGNVYYGIHEPTKDIQRFLGKLYNYLGEKNG